MSILPLSCPWWKLFHVHPCRICVPGLYINIDLSDHGNPNPGTPVTLWDEWEPGLNQLWLLQKVWGWRKQHAWTRDYCGFDSRWHLYNMNTFIMQNSLMLLVPIVVHEIYLSCKNVQPSNGSIYSISSYGMFHLQCTNLDSRACMIIISPHWGWRGNSRLRSSLGLGTSSYRIVVTAGALYWYIFNGLNSIQWSIVTPLSTSREKPARPLRRWRSFKYVR